ncbi:class I adenylate-forming enzyme family protein [Bradyrhizobium acaciae]|uniref:class I adenylate-forming enzyme family protein n=1 Tax=Bradyrhizobium acaciae TaxID=2683706 RepID=UPI001E50F168|nr:class I adenylate-forming enzyme family protein [Bradyrhizobium acaciae]MCC8982879.1 acyl--CoA ligase [Bradyrhizobium acaciae]
MTSASLTQSQLHDRVASASRRLDILETAYETITVPQLVSMRAQTHGSTIAIDIFERGERITYSEMDRWSNKYARALRAFGVSKGDRMAVMLPNRIEFPILWFGLAKLGAVLVPLNLRYTPREIEYVLSDTQPKAIIVDESVWPVFSTIDPWPQAIDGKRVILVGQPSHGAAATLDDLLKGVDDSPVDEDIRPDCLLSIQYTSGTTGFPKGCMLTHDYWGVMSYQRVIRDLQPYKKYLSAGPFFYSSPQWNLLSSYRQGGTLYLAHQLSSPLFFGWVKKFHIEWCVLPEPTARELIAAADATTCLKQVMQTDSWNPDTVRRFRERFRVRALDSYGMTEIGYATLPAHIEEMEESGSVGIRAPFRALRLVKEDGSPTQVGEVGELLVKGRAIFKGYWNRPEENAAAFEGEWFRTGDLLRRDELGFYWLVGRKKDMIRRLGDENISAREVEVVIREIPEIADVAAVPVPDVERGEEIKIYVQLKEGITPADLRVERILEHARARLAVFKRPRYIAFTPALPRTTSSDKVRKHELTAVSDLIAGAYDSEEKRWR